MQDLKSIILVVLPYMEFVLRGGCILPRFNIRIYVNVWQAPDINLVDLSSSFWTVGFKNIIILAALPKTIIKQRLHIVKVWDANMYRCPIDCWYHSCRSFVVSLNRRIKKILFGLLCIVLSFKQWLHIAKVWYVKCGFWRILFIMRFSKTAWYKTVVCCIWIGTPSPPS